MRSGASHVARASAGRRVQRPDRRVVAPDGGGYQRSGVAEAVGEDEPEPGGPMGPVSSRGLGQFEAPKGGGDSFVVVFHGSKN